jgi:uncharacterized protein YicC (UPF0701 family)
VMLGIGLASAQWGASTARASMKADVSRLELQMAELRKQTATQPKSPALDNATAAALKELQTALANLTTAREEDRQHLVAMIEELSTTHQEELVNLRKDLETVATHADDELQAARNRLTELSSVDSAAKHLTEGE